MKERLPKTPAMGTMPIPYLDFLNKNLEEGITPFALPIHQIKTKNKGFKNPETICA
jgi:hypothetical protein